MVPRVSGLFESYPPAISEIPILTCSEHNLQGIQRRSQFRPLDSDDVIDRSHPIFSHVLQDSSKNHKIVDDGYNIGRDWIVERAVRGTYYKSQWWRAEVEWNVEDLLTPGNKGAA